jgi:hypothetical protein
MQRKDVPVNGGWARRHYGWLLVLARGGLNGLAVSLGLIRAAHPAAASLAEGCAAGVQSAVLQLSAVNERYALYLSSCRSEGQRFARWASVSALYFALMKAAGILVGGAPAHLASLGAAYLRMVGYGTAQYPWVAAIALSRRLEGEVPGRCGHRIRFQADVRTMVVSAACVCVSALNSVGVSSSRLWLVGGGLLGTIYYWAVRSRWVRWLRKARPGVQRLCIP